MPHRFTTMYEGSNCQIGIDFCGESQRWDMNNCVAAVNTRPTVSRHAG